MTGAPGWARAGAAGVICALSLLPGRPPAARGAEPENREPENEEPALSGAARGTERTRA